MKRGYSGGVVRGEVQGSISKSKDKAQSQKVRRVEKNAGGGRGECQHVSCTHRRSEGGRFKYFKLSRRKGSLGILLEGCTAPAGYKGWRRLLTL